MATVLCRTRKWSVRSKCTWETWTQNCHFFFWIWLPFKQRNVVTGRFCCVYGQLGSLHWCQKHVEQVHGGFANVLWRTCAEQEIVRVSGKSPSVPTASMSCHSWLVLGQHFEYLKLFSKQSFIVYLAFSDLFSYKLKCQGETRQKQHIPPGEGSTPPLPDAEIFG